MQLLITRGQSGGAVAGSSPAFWLKGQIELTKDEQVLVDKYRMKGWPAYVGDAPAEIRRAALIAIPIAIIVFGILMAAIPEMTRQGTMASAAILVGIYVCIAYVIYHQIRETILLGDMLTGRSFKCKSIIDISDQEGFIRVIASHVRQMLEDMKNWGGREVVEVELPAKRTYFGSPEAAQIDDDDADTAPATIDDERAPERDDEGEREAPPVVDPKIAKALAGAARPLKTPSGNNEPPPAEESVKAAGTTSSKASVRKPTEPLPDDDDDDIAAYQKALERKPKTPDDERQPTPMDGQAQATPSTPAADRLAKLMAKRLPPHLQHLVEKPQPRKK